MLPPIKKAIFPVAGFGTRFLPATKSIPKEMLTIVDRPVIHYAVQEAIEAGCDTLIFITGRNKRAIEDYFDRAPDLEAELAKKKKYDTLNMLRHFIPSYVKCFYVRQPQALGLGHAIQCAASLVGDENFAVLLPDDLIDSSPQGTLSHMIDAHQRTGKGVLAVEEVALSQVEQYGVIQPQEVDARWLEVKGIVEKPTPKEAPSTWCVVGRYILTPTIMQVLCSQIPGNSGEIQLTDAIATSLDHTPFIALPLRGKRFDCGNKRGFLEANIHFGLKASFLD
jgi:UTP--glucose-1-phosphate uridylyltransferase